MTDYDLKPCLFCGHEIALSTRRKLVAFVCSGPDETCAGSGLMTCCTTEQLETAVAAWNRRAEDRADRPECA